VPNENENENLAANNNQFEPRSFGTTPSQSQPAPVASTPEPAANVPFEVEPPTSSLGATTQPPEPSPTPSFNTLGARPADDQAASFGTPAENTAVGGASGFGGTLDAPTSTNGLNVAPKKSKKRFVVAGIVAGILALLIAGGAAAYTLWYQNPDKVIGDALGNALTSKSATTDTKLTVKNGKGTAASTYDVKLKTVNDLKDARADLSLSSDADSASFDVSGSLVVKNNEKLYFKIDKLKELLEQSGLQMYLGNSASVTTLIEKLDSNWVVVTKDELEENTGTKDEASTCIEKATDKLRTDDAYSNDLKQLYEKYPLIGVKKKLGSQAGSLGYEIEYKRENAIKFANGVNSTKFFADLKKCDDKIENLDGEKMFEKDANDKDGEAKVVVWIDRWSHQFTKFELTGTSDDSNMTMTTTTQFNKPVTVEEPKDPITIDELKADIETIQQELMQANEASMNASIQESERLNEEMNTKGSFGRT
jgi:hypothetical protein